MRRPHILSLPAVAGLCLAAGASMAQAQEAVFSGTIGYGLSNLYGKEKVYDGSFKLSHLDWTSRNVPMLRGSLEIEVGSGWRVKANGRTSVGGGGEMTDYDWLYPYYSSTSKTGWSHRSISPDTNLDHYFDGSIEINKRLLGDDLQDLSVGIGAKYTDVQWTAKGGTFIYSTDAPRDTIGTFADGVKGITYQQKIPVLYATLNTVQKYGRFSFTGALEAGAAIKTRAPDDHWLRDLHFVDEFDVSPTYGAKAGVEYAFTDNIGFYFDGAVEQTDFKRGDTSVRDTVTGQKTHEEDAAGGSFAAIHLGIGVKGSF